jgi:hypothetical protein
MRRQTFFRLLWVITILGAVTLSCQTITGPVEDVIGAKDTALSLATDVEAIITEVDIEALVTEVDIEGIATEMEAIVTDMDLEGVATEFTGEKPEDIPMLEGAEEMIATSNFVSYSTSADLKTIVDFYNSQMPVNGWTKDETLSKVGEEDAELIFNKGARKAIVTIFIIPFVEQGNVSIVIEE